MSWDFFFFVLCELTKAKVCYHHVAVAMDIIINIFNLEFASKSLCLDSTIMHWACDGKVRSCSKKGWNKDVCELTMAHVDSPTLHLFFCFVFGTHHLVLDNLFYIFDNPLIQQLQLDPRCGWSTNAGAAVVCGLRDTEQTGWCYTVVMVLCHCNGNTSLWSILFPPAFMTWFCNCNARRRWGTERNGKLWLFTTWN